MFYRLPANHFYTCTVGVLPEMVGDIRHSGRKLLLHKSHPLKGFELNNKNIYQQAIAGLWEGPGELAPPPYLGLKQAKQNKNAEGRKAGRESKTTPYTPFSNPLVQGLDPPLTGYYHKPSFESSDPKKHHIIALHLNQPA